MKISKNTISTTIKETATTVKEAVSTLKEKVAGLSPDQAAKLAEGDTFHGSDALQVITEGTKLNLIGKAKLIGAAGGAAYGFVKLPSDFAAAAKDIREAVRTGTRHDAAVAATSTLDAAYEVVSVADKGLRAATQLNVLVTSYRAAKSAFSAMVPTASAALSKAAARAAMKATFEGVSKEVAHAAVGAVASTAGRTAVEAAEAAARAGAHAAATGSLAKVAARFAPGLNVAMASIDAGFAVATLADPEASTMKKALSVVTAAGSIASASNIPVVSQAGGAISTVSSIVGAFY